MSYSTSNDTRIYCLNDNVHRRSRQNSSVTVHLRGHPPLYHHVDAVRGRITGDQLVFMSRQQRDPQSGPSLRDHAH